MLSAQLFPSQRVLWLQTNVDEEARAGSSPPFSSIAAVIPGQKLQHEGEVH